MTTINWGLLKKSGVDSETIEQAIARLIVAHEEDPTAHLGIGESLEAHKSADIIDHPAYSVIDDKVTKRKYTLETFFDNDTGFSFFGSHEWWYGYLKLTTTTSLGNSSGLIANADDVSNYAVDFEKNPIFELVGNPYNANYFERYFGLGSKGDAGFIGFKHNASGLFGIYVTDDSVEHSIALTYSATGDIRTFRVEVISGDSIIWSVDGVVLYTLDISALSLLVGQGWVFSASTECKTAGHSDSFPMFRILFQQDF